MTQTMTSSRLADHTFRTHIGVPETFYCIEFFSDSTFETLETDPFPSMRRMHRGSFKETGECGENGGTRLELRYDDGPVVTLEFCICDIKTTHFIAAGSLAANASALVTRKTLVCSETLLPRSAAQVGWFARPLVWYVVQE